MNSDSGARILTSSFLENSRYSLFPTDGSTQYSVLFGETRNEGAFGQKGGSSAITQG